MTAAPVAGTPQNPAATGATSVTIAAQPSHHHVWTLREALHSELGTTESWFQCENCYEPYT